jgi:acetyltransferase-like isoleucine patch superfamily enzyme
MTDAARPERGESGLRRLRRWLGNLRRGVPPEIIRRAGPGFYCGHASWFRPDESIEIGPNVYIGHHAHIASPCVIGPDVMLASYVSLIGGDHRFDQPGVLLRKSGRGTMRPIIIEGDAWVGHGAILLGGTYIGRGAIIAAGSLVRDVVPPCEIWGGVPARRLKSRFATAEETEQHLAFLRARYGG